MTRARGLAHGRFEQTVVLSRENDLLVSIPEEDQEKMRCYVQEIMCGVDVVHHCESLSDTVAIYDKDAISMILSEHVIEYLASCPHENLEIVTAILNLFLSISDAELPWDVIQPIVSFSASILSENPPDCTILTTCVRILTVFVSNDLVPLVIQALQANDPNELLHFAIIGFFEAYLLSHGEYEDILFDYLWEFVQSGMRNIVMRALFCIDTVSSRHLKSFKNRSLINRSVEKLLPVLEVMKESSDLEGIKVMLSVLCKIVKMNDRNENMMLILNNELITKAVVETISVNRELFYRPASEIVMYIVTTVKYSANMLIDGGLMFAILDAFSPDDDAETKELISMLFVAVVNHTTQSRVPSMFKYLEIITGLEDLIGCVDYDSEQEVLRCIDILKVNCSEDSPIAEIFAEQTTNE